MHTSTTYPKYQRQRGFSIVTAIFLIVVLALLATAMVSIFSTSQQSISQELTSAKAYFAGRSALEWGMYQSIFDNDVIGPGNQTLTLSNGGLSNTSSIITFTGVNADGQTYYSIGATGRFGSAADMEFTQRQLQLQFQP